LNSKGIKGKGNGVEPSLAIQDKKESNWLWRKWDQKKRGPKPHFAKEPLKQRSLSKGLTSMTFQSLPIFKLLVILVENIFKKEKKKISFSIPTKDVT
jgi:hypothetical protein